MPATRRFERLGRFLGNWSYGETDVPAAAPPGPLEARMIFRDARVKAFAHGVFAAVVLIAAAVVLAPESDEVPEAEQSASR